MMIFGIMIGLPIAVAIWLAILVKWQRGMWMLILYLPFAGGIALMLRPSPVGTLFKDFLFVLPMYAVFALLHTKEFRQSRIPGPITLMLVLMSALVLLQLFNPGLMSVVVGAVGIKVWLLYLPLAYLASAMIVRAEDMIGVLRSATAVAVIPCVLGIVQFAMCSAIGYEYTMTLFYGANAAAATQDFTVFKMGAEFFRIPSTFSFVSQYSGYTLMMLVITYMHQSVEPNPAWRTFARIMTGVVFAACMLSGARANFLFAPMLFLTILFLDAKLTRMATGLIFGPIVMVATLQSVGLDVLQIVGETGGLVTQYGGDLVFPELLASLMENPLGRGVGSNTAAALNLMSAAEIARIKLIEGYYSKAVIELGIPGLLLLLLILFSLIVYALNIHRRLRDPMARSCSAAITGFIIIMALHSFKGNQIDLDPINVWYWILVGILFRLPELDFSRVTEERRRAIAEKRESKNRKPGRGRPSPGVRPAPQQRWN